MRSTSRFLVLLFIVAFLSTGWKQQASIKVDGPFFKMYLYDNQLAISEYQRGVRLYDVTNIAMPRLAGFLPLEGNADMAVSGNTMYCDSYRDLLVYDVSNPAAPLLRQTVKDVFNKVTFVDRFVAEPYQESTGGFWGCGERGCTKDEIVAQTDGGALAGGGQGGSMARFCINYNYLYCVDNTDLIVFDIVRPEAPVFVARIEIGWGIETIFPYRNYLFIGSRTHMYIFNANDVRKPVLISEFQHSRACDPVVVEDTLAYITLKSGTFCGPAPNAMHVVSIADPLNPRLLGTTDTLMLEGPFGLAVEDRIAYVCDGIYGLKVIDANDPGSMPLIGRSMGKDIFDAIKRGNDLFVIGPMGVYIYDVGTPANPRQIGEIANSAVVQ